MKTIALGYNEKKLRIIIILASILLSLLAFVFLRDTAKTVTVSEASKLYSQNRITKIVLDEEYLRLQTADGNFKIYKGAINTKPLFEKYPVEVVAEKSYLKDFLLFLAIIGIFAILFRMIKYGSGQQIEQLHREIDRAEEMTKPEEVRAIRSTVKFSDVAGIADVKEELEEIIDFLKSLKNT